MERIRGPVEGFYLVSYACQVGDLGEEFIGYTKLCFERPGNFWDAIGPVSVGTGRFPDASQAMDESERLALGLAQVPGAGSGKRLDAVA